MSSYVDDNFEYVTLAADDTTGEARPLLVDPVTGYLLVGIVIETSSDLAITATPIDENYQGVALAVDDTTGVVKPLKVNPTSNALLVTIP